MMKEITGPKLDSEKMVIRGAEQKLINASVNNSNISLGVIL